MKIVWMAGLAAVAMSGAAWSQSTIYKHVDESGRVTYTNKPMKGATVLELDPITTLADHEDMGAAIPGLTARGLPRRRSRSLPGQAAGSTRGDPRVHRR